jgi:serine/threonine protein kinase
MDPEATAAGQATPPARPAGAPAALGDVLDGRWSVVAILSGGQAWVLVVDDLKQGIRRAIKVSFSGPLAEDAELVALFGLEPCPYVVTAFDVVEVGGNEGLLLEYVPGSLADAVRGGRPGPLALLQEICAGMAHLSEHGEFAHLDLKPSNVLISDSGTAKVADFGLAQAVRIRDGRFPAAAGGTWAYAAPEVIRLEPCDSRADVFSFGVIFYQLSTGRLPYPFELAPSAGAQRAQLLDYYASPGPARRCEELYYSDQLTPTQLPVPPPSGAVGEIISDCMQDYPGRRPSSFSDLAERLAAEVGIPVVSPLPVPLAEPDRQRRVLVRAQALIRLRRFDEAVRALNRLLRGPVDPELSAQARDAARSALIGAGRPEAAAALERWT